MRGLLALVFALLLVVNTVNSGAIYRRYRQLELPLSGQSDAQSIPADNYVSELRKNQIPVQVVEVIEPVLVMKPVENLRSVEPEIALAADPEPAAVITNEIIPEKLDKLEENLETVRAIEQAVVAQEQEIQQPIAETVGVVVATADQGQIQGQGQQQLRNIEPETPALPAAPALLLVKETDLSQNIEESLPEIAEKKLPLLEESLPAALPEAIPEALPENLPKEPLALSNEKNLEEAKPLAAEPLLKTIKESEPAKEIIQETPAVKEDPLPALVEKQSDLKLLEEQVAPAEVQPQLKVLKEEAPLIETPAKLEEKMPELKEELLENKEENKEMKMEQKMEDKKEMLKEAIEEAVKEEIKEVLKEKSQVEMELNSKNLEEVPISGRQADTADPGPTTARPAQPGIIQQLVQNTPLGQFLNNFNGGNNQAAAEQNTPVATAATFIQALQNTTSQITNSIQQGFQQQLQSFQATLTGQQPQQQADTADNAASPTPTPRPQGPIQSLIAQPGIQGILNLFGGNRPSTASPSTSTPAAAAAATPVKNEAAPAEEAASAEAAQPAADESSAESARDSGETADDSLEAVKPDEIVVNDDDTHE